HKPRPEPLLSQPVKSLAAGDAVDPGAKQLRVAEPAQFAPDHHEDFLQDVVRKMLVGHQPDEVTANGPLNTLEQLRECLTVPRLGEQDQRYRGAEVCHKDASLLHISYF